MKVRFAGAIFVVGLLALFLSIPLSWNISVRGQTVGILWPLADWLRLFLLLIVCILAGMSLLTVPSDNVQPGLDRKSVLETPRLIIRRFRKEDWRDLHEYLSDKEVVRYEPYDVYDERLSRLEAESRADDSAFLAVCLKSSGKMIGNLYIAGRDFGAREIGYVFNPQFQKQGYATEAVIKLIDTAFRQWRVRKIIAMCDPRNENSWHLLERAGLRREGHFLEKATFKNDASGNPIWHDAYEYGLLASEWRNKIDDQ